MEHRNNFAGQRHDDAATSAPEPIDFHRLAKLVADGEVPFPLQLHALDRQQLWSEVSRLRRDRLVRYIAQAIAVDIHQSREH